ncbi:hypothetical protein C2G38_2288482 [Gigaspora rosea]|uniref:F-box domain-containing protein n=1 Tax=Gigaspora rosea TaxID=44941 RepID=A0A397VMJ8_9GLOM|nr:hypothetical protein C2G38_2288482 [Gigaspora rosea]
MARVEMGEHKAFIYYQKSQKSAEMGDDSGTCSVGYCYQNGIGIEKDDHKTFIYYQKSVEMGHVLVKNNSNFFILEWDKQNGLVQNISRNIKKNLSIHGIETTYGRHARINGKILNNLNNEIDSLYSCALVSRYWCKIAIPIRWKDPFSFDENYSIIPKYFSSFSEDTLKECELNEKISKTLFVYAKFLKTMKHLDYFEQNDYPSLLKLFIESGATLHKLVVSFRGSIMIMPEKIFSSLGRNESFFSRLQHLSLGEISLVNIESAIAFLRVLPKHTTKISALEFYGFEFKFTDMNMINMISYN